MCCCSCCCFDFSRSFQQFFSSFLDPYWLCTKRGAGRLPFSFWERLLSIWLPFYFAVICSHHCERVSGIVAARQAHCVLSDRTINCQEWKWNLRRQSLWIIAWNFIVHTRPWGVRLYDALPRNSFWVFKPAVAFMRYWHCSDAILACWGAADTTSAKHNFISFAWQGGHFQESSTRGN